MCDNTRSSIKTDNPVELDIFLFTWRWVEFALRHVSSELLLIFREFSRKLSMLLPKSFSELTTS